MTAITMGDVILLLQQDWVPDQKKDQLKNMILDTIDMAEQMTKDMQKKFGET